MSLPSSGREDSRSRKPGIRWDEVNLEENERIKKELNPRKIDEPKTPYLSPLETEDEDGEVLGGAGVAPLSLEDVDPSLPRRVHTHGAWSDSSDYQNGAGSPSPRSAGSGGGGAKASFSPRFSEEYYVNDSEDEEEGDGAKEEKRRKFKEARKAHYGMKEAMRRAKELMTDDEVMDEEGEVDEVESAAAMEEDPSSTSNGNAASVVGNGS